jgi:hypothetical protein
MSTEAKRNRVYIVVNQGQIQCSLSSVAVRSDDEPAKTLLCSSPASGRTEFGYFNIEEEALEIVFETKKQIRIQVTLFQYGQAVFRFPVSGLSLPTEFAAIRDKRLQSEQRRKEERYLSEVSSAVRRNTRFGGRSLEVNSGAEFQVQLKPDCGVLGFRLLRSSGAPFWDKDVERAILATDQFPKQDDGTCRSEVVISVTP